MSDLIPSPVLLAILQNQINNVVICSNNEPTFAINSGSLWYDTLNKKLKVYYNETWNEV